MLSLPGDRPCPVRLSVTTYSTTGTFAAFQWLIVSIVCTLRVEEGVFLEVVHVEDSQVLALDAALKQTGDCKHVTNVEAQIILPEIVMLRALNATRAASSRDTS